MEGNKTKDTFEGDRMCVGLYERGDLSVDGKSLPYAPLLTYCGVGSGSVMYVCNICAKMLTLRTLSTLLCLSFHKI